MRRRLIGVVLLAAFLAADVAGAHQQAPRVVVTASGYTQDLSDPPHNDIAYGLALANRSTTENAVNVQIDVSLRDSKHRTVGSDSQTVSVIPAGGTFYVAGYVEANVSLRVTSLVPVIHVGSSTHGRIALPPTSRITFSKGSNPGGPFVNVRGSLRNPYAWALSSDATIYTVLFDRHGRIVGGGSINPGVAVQAHATVSFALDEFDIFPAPMSATYARLSVDPCAPGDAAFGDCQAVSPAKTSPEPSPKPEQKAAYVSRMKAIGRSLSTSLNSLGSATTAAKAAVALTSVQSDLRKAADRIESITPPVAVTAQHAQLAKAVSDFADELDPVIAKLRAGKITALQTVPTLKGLREIQAASTAIANKGYRIGG
jgi:hypothetical protein